MSRSKSKKLISIIIPVFNEQDSIKPLYNALCLETKKLKSYEFEMIFVNDGSEDASIKTIHALATKDKRVKPIDFVRNFGKEIATTAGLHHAQGDAAIMLDADLQHPPRLIHKFLAKWEDGFEVVTGVRKKNYGHSWYTSTRSKLFYALFNKVSDIRLVSGATDYQLIDRAVIEEFNRFTERGRITRGLISWLGFPTGYVFFEADKRAHGSATYSTFKLARLAINSFVSLSLFPLKLAGYMGLYISLLAGVLGLYMGLDRFVLNNPFNFGFSGTALLAVLIVFLVGILLSCLGLIALYIGTIHSEVANRPLYVIRKPRK